jgi:putative ABC transport system permease protein
LKIVTKSFLRYLPRRLSLSFLQLMGVACGVAAVVGMTMSALTALASFTKAVGFLSGKATHSMQRPAGPMDESTLVKLAHDPAVDRFSPVIDRRLRLSNGDLVRFLGIDPFLDQAMRPEIADVEVRRDTGGPGGSLSFLLDADSVIIDKELAQQLRLSSGATLQTTRGPFRVIGTFTNPSGEPLVLMDIGHAQRLFALQGFVDRVDLILTDESGFRARWEDGFLIQSGRQRSATFSAMLGAFRLNLEALSLLALFVGVFLIYNTAMFAVVNRRRDSGILRSLGARRYEIVAAFLTEILILGFIGGALGGVIGYFLTRFLTALIGTSITDLYFFLRPEPLAWSSWILFAGIGLGCGASILGGALPLLEIVRTDPVKALSGRVASRKSAHLAHRVSLASLLILAISAILLTLPHTHIYVGFAGVFGFLIGASLLTGTVLVAIHPGLRWLLGCVGRLPGKVAAGNIRQNLGRTAVAVAAFMVALSMSVGLGAMIGSFRQSLVWWMDSQLRGELYIGKIGEADVPEAFYEEVKRMPGLGGADPYRNVQVLYRGLPVYVASVDASVVQRFTRFGWLKGGNENWESVKQGGVVISESFSRRFDIKSGDTVVLHGAHGPAEFKVGGIFYDYTTEHGLLMMDRSTFLRVFGDHTINSLAAFIDPTNPRRLELIQEIKKKAEARGLPVQTQSQLRASILKVFDNTFAVTRSMRALAIVVAFFGIAGALLTLFMERRRDFGIYRSLGFSTGQIATMTLLEGLGMGAVSYLLSIGAGTILAVLLINVINLRSFNWTIFFYPELGPYVWTAITALVASLGAAAYPIWKVCRTYPQMQIREE